VGVRVQDGLPQRAVAGVVGVSHQVVRQQQAVLQRLEARPEPRRASGQSVGRGAGAPRPQARGAAFHPPIPPRTYHDSLPHMENAVAPVKPLDAGPRSGGDRPARAASRPAVAATGRCDSPGSRSGFPARHVKVTSGARNPRCKARPANEFAQRPEQGWLWGCVAGPCPGCRGALS
jgi:hypothetical protein